MTATQAGRLGVVETVSAAGTETVRFSPAAVETYRARVARIRGRAGSARGRRGVPRGLGPLPRPEG